MTEQKPFDVTIRHSKAAFARFMTAVVRFRARVTDSFVTISADRVYLRVFLLAEDERAFFDVAKPEEMRDPPRVDLGWGEAGQHVASKEQP